MIEEAAMDQWCSASPLVCQAVLPHAGARMVEFHPIVMSCVVSLVRKLSCKWFEGGSGLAYLEGQVEEQGNHALSHPGDILDRPGMPCRESQAA